MSLPYHDIIGFDLGHAHTTLARVPVTDRTALDTLEIGKRAVQTTAIKRVHAIDSTPATPYKVQIGDRIFNRIKPDEELHLAFKAPPPGDALYELNMREFFCAVLEDLQASGIMSAWDGVMIVVGCPSAWEPKVRKKYQMLLTDPRFPTPVVVSESRAALLNAIGSQGRLTQEEVEGTILTVDVGSSTVDFTIIHGSSSEEPLYTFGDELGGSFFDNQILALGIERHPKADQLRALLAGNRNLKHLLLYTCRKIKERYFESPEDFEETPVKGLSEDLGDLIFDPKLNGEMMREILATPTRSGLPWKATFEHHLLNARSAAQQKGYAIRAVVLTGGAARMGFVPDTVRKIFPESEGITLIMDNAPHASVARGLALWGRGDVLVKSFRAEIKHLFAEEVPALVERHQGQLLELLIPALADKIINEFVVPGLMNWKDRAYNTTAELKEALNNQTEAWIKSEAGQQFFVSITNQWWDEGVRDEFSKLVGPICKAHDVPVGALDIRHPYTVAGFDATNLSVPIPLEEIVRIVGYIIFWLIVWVLPLGGPLLAAFITLLFKEAVDSIIDEFMQHADMPRWARDWVSDDKIQRIGQENRQRIIETMTAKLSGDTEFMTDLQQHLCSQLQDDVEREAKKIENRLYSGN